MFHFLDCKILDLTSDYLTNKVILICIDIIKCNIGLYIVLADIEHTHTCTGTCTRTCSHAHVHTHTHTQLDSSFLSTLLCITVKKHTSIDPNLACKMWNQQSLTGVTIATRTASRMPSVCDCTAGTAGSPIPYWRGSPLLSSHHAQTSDKLVQLKGRAGWTFKILTRLRLETHCFIQPNAPIEFNQRISISMLLECWQNVP